MNVLHIVKKSAVITSPTFLGASSQLMISTSPFIQFLLCLNLLDSQGTQVSFSLRFCIHTVVMGKNKTSLIEKGKYLLSRARAKNDYLHKFMYTHFLWYYCKAVSYLNLLCIFHVRQKLGFCTLIVWLVGLVWGWFSLVLFGWFGLVWLVLLLNPVLPRSWDCVS